jgi:aryl-alcohol dehydrogenase-like predicted oxidoreductase
MQTIAQNKQASVAQIALAWLLHQPVVTSVIVGSRKPEQLMDNLKSVDVKLSAEELQQLNAVSELKPEYPGWMINMQTEERHKMV